MTRKLRRQTQDKFGARRRLRQLQKRLREEENRDRITAPIIRQKTQDTIPDDDLMGEETFEQEMERPWKREP